MFLVDEETVEAIRHAMAEGGEFSAAIELRQRFPGITDNAEAWHCVRMIASWPTRQEIAARLALRPEKRGA